MNSGVVNLSASHPFGLQGNDQCRNSFPSWASGSNGGSAIISEDAVCYPLLGSIHDVMVSRALCRGHDSRNIRSGCLRQGQFNLTPMFKLTIRLCDAQAESCPTSKYVWHKPPFLLFRPEIQQRRSADGVAAAERPDDAQIPTTRYFIDDDQVMEGIPFCWRSTGRETPGDKRGSKRVDGCCSVSQFCMTFENSRRHDTLGFPFFAEGRDLRVHVFSHFALEAAVRVVVVRARWARMPQWVGKGSC